MTETEVKDSIIYSGWYHKVDDIMGYNLSPNFMDMLRCGYGKIFTPIDIDEVVLPIQMVSFYCLNKDGYVKIFTKMIGSLDNLSLNDFWKIIENICKEVNIKFVALSSNKYSWIEIEKMLGDNCKFEYNKEGDSILIFK